MFDDFDLEIQCEEYYSEQDDWWNDDNELFYEEDERVWPSLVDGEKYWKNLLDISVKLLWVEKYINSDAKLLKFIQLLVKNAAHPLN